jgi:uncharacterized protein
MSRLADNQLPITISESQIADFCQRHHIRRLALFGSVLREDFKAESDVDVLVEFDTNARIGWEIVSIADELSAILGRQVDLRTPMELSRHFRKQVLSEAQVIYERAG